jgi:transporter family protein
LKRLPVSTASGCVARQNKRIAPMKYLFSSWQAWALLSAAFAALTAIFAKIGIENVNSDFATFVRTVVILIAIGLMLFFTGNWQAPA